MPTGCTMPVLNSTCEIESTRVAALTCACHAATSSASLAGSSGAKTRFSRVDYRDVAEVAPEIDGAGALWQPMAVLMMSGPAVASLLTLFFVPAGYFLLFRSYGGTAKPVG